MKYCKKCGAEMGDSAKYCGNCGAMQDLILDAKVEEPETVTKPEPEAAPEVPDYSSGYSSGHSSYDSAGDAYKTASKKTNTWMILVALIAVLAVVLVMVLGKHNSGSSGGSGSTVPASGSTVYTEPVVEDLDDGNKMYSGYPETYYETEWFDFTVTGYSFADSWEYYEPDTDNEMIVVDITLYGTYPGSTTMFDTDFVMFWDDDSADAYAYPITYEGNVEGEGMLPETYTLDEGQELSGRLVYEVPKSSDWYALCFDEIFSDNTYGNRYVVFMDR